MVPQLVVIWLKLADKTVNCQYVSPRSCAQKTGLSAPRRLDVVFLGKSSKVYLLNTEKTTIYSLQVKNNSSPRQLLRRWRRSAGRPAHISCSPRAPLHTVLACSRGFPVARVEKT